MHEDEQAYLSNIHKDFIGNGISSMELSNTLLHGRPYGGVGILWRKTLGTCKIHKIDPENRLLQLDIVCSGGTISIVNVYCI